MTTTQATALTVAIMLLLSGYLCGAYVGAWWQRKVDEERRKRRASTPKTWVLARQRMELAGAWQPLTFSRDRRELESERLRLWSEQGTDAPLQIMTVQSWTSLARASMSARAFWAALPTEAERRDSDLSRLAAQFVETSREPARPIETVPFVVIEPETVPRDLTDRLLITEEDVEGIAQRAETADSVITAALRLCEETRELDESMVRAAIRMEGERRAALTA